MAKQLMDVKLNEQFEMYVLLKDAKKRVAKNGNMFCHWCFKINQAIFPANFGMQPPKCQGVRGRQGSFTEGKAGSVHEFPTD